MAKGTIAKVMKFQLTYLDGSGDFHEMQEYVWQLQKQTHEILNKTIQMSYHWDYQNSKAQKETGQFLDILKETGYKRLDGYIYDSIKDAYENMSAQNLNATIQKAWKKYNNSKKEIFRGAMSVPSFRSNQPLVIKKDGVKLEQTASLNTVELALFSKAFKKEHSLSSNVRFSVLLNDNTQRSIFNNLIDGVYGLGECQLIYEKRKWFLLLTYRFDPVKRPLDPNKILGVDLGECVAVYASVFQEFGALRLDGGEVSAFAKKMEARVRSMQRQAANCGEGRIGHGTKTRVSAVYQQKDKIANFRDTINHRYSKAIIDFALKHQCGVIQMEDLSGIKSGTDFPKFLRHWTYYDLQSKIEAKAKENGIAVVKIKPEYTSQRCSRCGNIDPDNRKTQADFRCTSCGFHANADYNASQNIAIKNISEIISESIGARLRKP